MSDTLIENAEPQQPAHEPEGLSDLMVECSCCLAPAVGVQVGKFLLLPPGWMTSPEGETVCGFHCAETLSLGVAAGELGEAFEAGAIETALDGGQLPETDEVTALLDHEQATKNEGQAPQEAGGEPSLVEQLTELLGEPPAGLEQDTTQPAAEE